MASLRLSLAFTTTFTTGIISGYVFAATTKSTNQQKIYINDSLPDAESVNLQLTELINKHSTNVSISNASLEAKKLAVIIGKHGFPSYSNLRFYSSYCCSMNYMRSIPNWVAEYITIQDIQSNQDRIPQRGPFYHDESIPQLFRAQNNDYKETKYDRGHLAAAGNHINSKQQIKSTMNLSNIIPQNASMNRGIWNKLEQYVRTLIKSNKYDSCLIISGPIFKPSNSSLFMNLAIGNNMLHVPTHLFKVVLAEKKLNDKIEYDLFTFIIENKKTKSTDKQQPKHSALPFNQYMAKRTYIEKLTGLQFFPALFDDEQTNNTHVQDMFFSMINNEKN